MGCGLCPKLCPASFKNYRKKMKRREAIGTEKRPTYYIPYDTHAENSHCKDM